MTVVCYDGTTLAADRKSTRKDGEGVRHVRALNKDKIKVPEQPIRFAGEQVYAIGRAGRVKITEYLLTHLTPQYDLTKRMHWLNTRLAQFFLDKPVAAASLLIMTDKGIHHLAVTKQGTALLRSYPKGKKLAIGSGKKEALTLMTCLNLPAVAACAVMELHDDSCGGGVSYTSRKRIREGRPNSLLIFETTDDISIYVHKRQVRTSRRQLKRLVPQEPQP